MNIDEETFKASDEWCHKFKKWDTVFVFVSFVAKIALWSMKQLMQGKKTAKNNKWQACSKKKKI